MPKSKYSEANSISSLKEMCNIYSVFIIRMGGTEILPGMDKHKILHRMLQQHRQTYVSSIKVGDHISLL